MNSAADLGAPPGDLDGQRALRELLGRPAYDDSGASALVSIDVDRLALPRPGFKPVSLTALLGEDEAALLVDRVLRKLRPDHVVEAARRDSKCKQPYVDPAFTRNKRKYVKFIRALRMRNFGYFPALSSVYRRPLRCPQEEW